MYPVSTGLRRIAYLAGISLANLLVTSVLPVQAATISLGSGCTLAQAFEAAHSNSVPSGSSCSSGDQTGADEDIISLSSDVTLTSEISLRVPGAGPHNQTVAILLKGNGHTLRGGNSSAKLVVGEGVRLTIHDATLRDFSASAGGAIKVDKGVLVVASSHFENNSSDSGGAIQTVNQAELQISDSVFRDNIGDRQRWRPLYRRPGSKLRQA